MTGLAVNELFQRHRLGSVKSREYQHPVLAFGDGSCPEVSFNLSDDQLVWRVLFLSDQSIDPLLKFLFSLVTID